jgi:hypothetical protein
MGLETITKRVGIAAALMVWISIVAAGTAILWRYADTPGLPAAPPARWPSGGPLRLAGGRTTLLMFVHPHCPCSKASMGELAIIIAQAGRTLDPYVIFHKPADAAADWTQTDLWDEAKSIPGVHVIEDPAGAIAAQFGVSTSGQTLLYSPAGGLLFRGGITASRGHAGDSNGRAAVITLARGGTPDQESTPVFGCSLKGN